MFDIKGKIVMRLLASPQFLYVRSQKKKNFQKADTISITFVKQLDSEVKFPLAHKRAVQTLFAVPNISYEKFSANNLSHFTMENQTMLEIMGKIVMNLLTLRQFLSLSFPKKKKFKTLAQYESLLSINLTLKSSSL